MELPWTEEQMWEQSHSLYRAFNVDEDERPPKRDIWEEADEQYSMMKDMEH